MTSRKSAVPAAGKKQDDEMTYSISSGNVFADLGRPNAAEALVKADLARQIGTIIRDRGLTQTGAARILGVDQPKVSALLRGRLSGFSIDRLIRYAAALGQEVQILIRPKGQLLRVAEDSHTAEYRTQARTSLDLEELSDEEAAALVAEGRRKP
jgi:predicted XRE-type DNA-binding protein